MPRADMKAWNPDLSEKLGEVCAAAFDHLLLPQKWLIRIDARDVRGSGRYVTHEAIDRRVDHHL